jgi:hypothetical protein
MLCRSPVCQEIFKHVLEGVPTGEYEQTIKVSIDAAPSQHPGLHRLLASFIVASCPSQHRTLAAGSF